ncbi:2-dehydropantoate 2-reductase [Photobacterium nomapromontoriensis]|uniref:2-dehydropantoate 2-reductase n=1 Tax=Photobacterium nomapromontoriensis TaxID=2910237 RepID=UPI003D117435
MNITIVGAGAIGRLWGCHLAAKHTVHFWTRNQAPHITFEFTSKHSALKQSMTFSANQPQQLQDANCIIIAVKAFQVENALLAIKPYLAPGVPVIIMHNGMGSHQQAIALLPEQPLLYATTAQAAFRPEPHRLCHAGIGQTWLGAVNDQGSHYQSLQDELNQALPPCQWHQDIFIPLWQKLAINCAINPLTAIHQCRNGELATPQFHHPLNEICFEVATVMNAEGYPATHEKLRQQVDKVIAATADNFSSMNQDVCHHRTTEIDYITGYLITRAAEHQLAVPVNQRLWQQVKRLEQQYHDA